jgi:hypothetical protein
MALTPLNNDGSGPVKEPRMVVRGVVATTGPDRDGEMMDPKWLGKALREVTGSTVTTNFDHTPVGAVIGISTGDGGDTYEADVEIFSDEAKQKICAGTLEGLGISIEKAERQPYNDVHGIITGGRINRVTLLDHDFWTHE